MVHYYVCVCYWSLSCTRLICSMSSRLNPFLLRHIPPLSSDLCVGIPSTLSPNFYQLKFCMHFSSSHVCYMSRPSHPPWLDHSNNISWSVQVMKLLFMQSSPAFHHFLPLQCTSPQFPVVRKVKTCEILQFRNLSCFRLPEIICYRNHSSDCFTKIGNFKFSF